MDDNSVYFVIRTKRAHRACKVLVQGQYKEMLCVNCCYLSEVQGWRKKGDCARGVGDGEEIRSQWGKDAPEELRVVLVSWRKA